MESRGGPGRWPGGGARSPRGTCRAPHPAGAGRIGSIARPAPGGRLCGTLILGGSQRKPPSEGRADAVTVATGKPVSPGRDCFLRKEVIQPQVPLRLPCYDLVPITGFIFGA